jgi:uncharacterized membrane protein
MFVELESSLLRWVEAQLIDPQQADRIRAFETAEAPARRARWPVIVALAFGGIMLAAGVLLFVSAHWDDLSPFQRMALLVAAVGGFHIAGAFSLDRFRALGITLHAAGTVALGGAIALAGQIFNMQEHWPTAVLLWAAGAIVGWLLLRDWPQLAMAAILTPWWLLGEWTEAVNSAHISLRVVSVAVLMLAISYLSVRMPGADSRKDLTRLSLAWLGGLAILPATSVVALAHEFWNRSTTVDTTIATVGWAGAILIPLAVAYAFRRTAVWMNAVAAVWVIGLSVFADQRAELMIYAWCAIGAAGMIAWGIYEFRAERINLGMAGFAITIVAFFFSSVMDKLGRSASLITLGALLLAGGWQWEKLRRNLLTQIRPGGVQ